MTVLDTLQGIARDPYAVARQWKADGAPVIGLRCLYVPEEVIWAAGALPHPLYGTPEPVTLADAYFQPCACELVRNLWDHALRGDLAFLDGLALSNTCDVVRRLSDMWERHQTAVSVHLLNNPQKLLSDANKAYFLEELRRFRVWVEARTGREVTDDALRAAIEAYDTRRRLLREIWDMRVEDPPPLRGSEALEVALAASVLPVDRAIALLGELKEELDTRVLPEEDGPRILVTGSLIDHPALLRLIEEVGGQVVTEDLCVTTRSFWHLVNPDGGRLADPMEAIWAYMNQRPLCACIHPADARTAFVLELVERYEVEAVVSLILKYCHPFLYEAPLLGRALKEREIPSTVLDVGHDLSGHGQLRTRLQAFVEMVEL